MEASMVIMRRDVPEKSGHPVEMNVQECDVNQLQKRGWYVVNSSATPEKQEKKEEPIVEQTVQPSGEPVSENKARKSMKRHEV